MITKQLLKDEIDHVQNEYLHALYKIIKAFGEPTPLEHHAYDAGAQRTDSTEIVDWQTFIQETYGCLADDPIERGTQGAYELREDIT